MKENNRYFGYSKVVGAIWTQEKAISIRWIKSKETILEAAFKIHVCKYVSSRK